MRRSLAIREKTLGPDNPTVGTGMNNLAAVLLTLDSVPEAERLIIRAVAIAEKSYGPSRASPPLESMPKLGS